jgi:hypothetical protein
MRRVALSLAALFALAAPAQASEHQQRINEVGLDVGSAQFLELLDSAPEPFPNPPYKIGVYGPDGASVGDVPIDKAAIAGRTTPVLVASQPAVNGQARDLPLTVTLPTDGQACFENKLEKLACVAWGNVTTKLSGTVAATESTSSPPATGKSFSRCPRGPVIAAATPKAANACPDLTKPVATVAARTQKLAPVLASGYRFTVRSNEKGKAKAQLLRRGKVVATSTKPLAARVTKPFALRPSKPTRDALAGSMSATFTLRVVVTDAAGNARTINRPVTVKRT